MKNTVQHTSATKQFYDGEGRLIIVIQPGQPETVELAVKALANSPTVFVRGHELVRVTRASVHAGDGDDAREGKGPLRIQALRARGALQQVLTHVAVFMAQGKDKAPRARNAPAYVLNCVLALGEWPGIRTIVGVIETPTMSPSLRLITEPGYDAGTGYFLDTLREYPAVPEAPTAAELGAAWQAILEPFCDFAFDSEADRYDAIASAMTIILRPAIRGSVPAFKRSPLEAFCVEHHPRFVVAVLTLARAYKLAGRPRANPPLKSVGSCGAWAELIPELICFAGGADIIGNVPMDRITGFFGAHCAFRAGAKTTAKALGDAYLIWCEKNGVSRRATPNEIAKRLVGKGCQSAKSNGKRGWLGVEIV